LTSGYMYSAAVFPAYAGVIPLPAVKAGQFISVPRVCGGDPGSGIVQYDLAKCSPRMRG